MSSISAGSLIAVVRAAVIPDPAGLITVLRDAGVSHVELTFTTPRVLDALRQVADLEGVSIGAGTVLTRGQARDSIEAGAQFLVTPAIRPDVASVAHEANVPPIMGALTPTEMLAAVDLGAEAVKVFPGGALGDTSRTYAARSPTCAWCLRAV